MDINIAAILGGLSPREINKLYKATSFLDICPLKKCIAAVMACRVFIRQGPEPYLKKKEELDLK